MNGESFDLICEYVHCREKRVLVVGSVDSAMEATTWVREQQDLASRGIFNYRDSNFDCPVTLCALKECVPTFSYRPHEIL